MNTYCLGYKAPIYSIRNPSKPRGWIWSFRENPDVKYMIDEVIGDFEKKNNTMVVGEVVSTFHMRCPVEPENKVFIEMYDET